MSTDTLIFLLVLNTNASFLQSSEILGLCKANFISYYINQLWIPYAEFNGWSYLTSNESTYLDYKGIKLCLWYLSALYYMTISFLLYIYIYPFLYCVYPMHMLEYVHNAQMEVIRLFAA